MNTLISLHIRFIDKKTEKPINGKNLKVILYDKDPFKDDYLGEEMVNENGETSISFYSDSYKSYDSPFEKHPDIYFILYENGDELYRSPVVKDMPVEETSDFSFTEGFHFDLGTFLIG